MLRSILKGLVILAFALFVLSNVVGCQPQEVAGVVSEGLSGLAQFFDALSADQTDSDQGGQGDAVG